MGAMLLILDMTLGELNQNTPPNDKIIENIKKLIQAFEKSDQLIVFSNTDIDGKIIAPLQQQCNNKHHIFHMFWYSPFEQERFTSLLNTEAIHDIFICGSDTSDSVLKSTMDAFQYDQFNEIRVVGDACCDDQPNLEQAALNIMSHIYGSDIIITSEETIDWVKR